ncbi:MAG: DUF1425 domain-containing protein [bacterium]
MKKTVLPSLLVVLIVCACSRPGPYVPAGQSPSVEDIHPVVLLDKSLKKKIAVDHTQGRKLPDNRLEVVANLRNRGKRDVQVQVQTIFKNESGYSTQEDSAWSMVFLSAHETETYQIVSRGRDAARYTVRIREAR